MPSVHAEVTIAGALHRRTQSGQWRFCDMTIVLVGPGTKRSDGWLWRRYLIEGTRLEPGFIASMVQAEGSREAVAGDYDLTLEQVDEAVAWHERRSRAAKRSSAS